MRGEVIGIIAPSRPIYNIRKEVTAGIAMIKKMGYEVKLGKNLHKHFYYSAGTIAQRLADIHEMFSDKKVRAIICATGGISSGQLIDRLDYQLIKRNPKIFLGYSDITSLLLAINKKTGLPTYYGPTVYDFATLSDAAKKFFVALSSDHRAKLSYPAFGEVWRSGRARGHLVGGVLMHFASLLATPFMPDLKGKILFFEEIGESPAMLDFLLQHLKLAGVFDKISGLIVGHLEACVDKKYRKDNRAIAEIVLERTAGYKFPILKVNYFGHEIKNFFTLPIGAEAQLDAGKKRLVVNL